ELVVDVAARVCDRVGVFERYLLRVAEERARRVVVERVELLRREAEPAAHGSVGVLSELATVPPGDSTVEERPERPGHTLRLLLEGGPHPLCGTEERRVARVEEVGIEWRAPELALFVERVAQVVRRVSTSTGGIRVFRSSMAISSTSDSGAPTARQES